ncbi:hypothetical protein [Streptomyces sp. NPDC057616]|uniref:hypothetical protein n=1 Tax=Streptomyces sp. NPDC057616 TaxID=3346183 RepID=UPI0036A852B3
MLRPHVQLPRPGHPGGGEANTDTVRLIPPEAAPPAGGEAGHDPVFVDTSGRRGLRMRRLAYTAGALCAAYTGVLVLSFLGATPFAPRTVLPVPGLPSEKPGSVQQPPDPLPGTVVVPESGGASLSPSGIPRPSGSPTASATRGADPTAPTQGSGAPSGPTGATTPPTSPPASPGTGPASPGTSPPASVSPSGAGTTPPATPSEAVSSPGAATSGGAPSAPNGAPSSGEAAPGAGVPSSAGTTAPPGT